MIFPGRTTPLVTGRCISSYPDTSEPNLLQKTSRFCLNIKMALMVLLIVSFKTREIFEGGFCFIPLFLLGSGHVVTKTAAVNFIALKIYFHLNYSFLLVVFSLGIYHHNLSDYLKAYSIMFAFQQTHSTCDCQLHAVLVSLTIVIESPLCKFSKRLLDVGIKLFPSSLSLPLLHRQWVEALKSCWKSPGQLVPCGTASAGWVGPDDLQGSHPSSAILWFCDFGAMTFHMLWGFPGSSGVEIGWVPLSWKVKDWTTKFGNIVRHL